MLFQYCNNPTAQQIKHKLQIQQKNPDEDLVYYFDIKFVVS